MTVFFQMTAKLRVFCTVFILLAPWQSLFAASADNVESLMSLSGMDFQIDQVHGQMEAGLAQVPATEQAAFIKQILADSFEPQKLSTDIKKFLMENLTDKDVNTVSEWLKSPLGKKITKIEMEGSSLEAMTNVQANMQTLLADEERVAKMKILDDAVRGVDHAVNIATNVQHAMMTAMMSVMPANQRLPQGQIDAMVDSMAGQVREQMESLMIASMVSIYKPLEDEQLNEYIAFLKKPTSQKYNEAVFSAFDYAMTQASFTMGQKLANVIQEEQAKQDAADL